MNVKAICLHERLLVNSCEEMYFQYKRIARITRNEMLQDKKNNQRLNNFFTK